MSEAADPIPWSPDWDERVRRVVDAEIVEFCNRVTDAVRDAMRNGGELNAASAFIVLFDAERKIRTSR